MYEKLFWLDDSPTFLPSLGIDLVALLNRTTFAFDFNQAKNIVSRVTDFDLHILDGDFPNEIETDLRVALNDWLESIRRGNEPDVFTRYSGNIEYDNFIPFYEQLLQDRKVIVHSASLVAAEYACKVHLPFYSKRSGYNEKDVEHMVDSAWRTTGWKLDPEGWEFGSTKDMVERYLK